MTESSDIPVPSSEAPAPTPARRAGVGMLFGALSLMALGTLAYASLPEAEPSGPAQTAAASAPTAFEGVTLQAKSAVVVDISTGATLFALEPDAQLPLASLTKVALALAVSEALSQDDMLTIPRDTAPPGSAERLGKGETWRVRDVIDFTLVASSNGGAEILADAANAGIHATYPQSPAEGATLWRMNDLVKQLGLERTYYLNVSGLDESATLSGGYGSALDMAKLFAYAASARPDLFARTARDGVLLTSVNGKNSTSAINTNGAQGAIPGLIMGKTGLTDLAGGNLAVVFDVGVAHPIVAVVLGSTKDGRFSDMEELVKRARNAVTGG